MNAHTRRERYKESDHDCVQVTLRATAIPQPKARATLRQSTLQTDANERNERSRLETRRKEPPGRVLSRDGTLHTNT